MLNLKLDFFAQVVFETRVSNQVVFEPTILNQVVFETRVSNQVVFETTNYTVHSGCCFSCVINMHSL